MTINIKICGFTDIDNLRLCFMPEVSLYGINNISSSKRYLSSASIQSLSEQMTDAERSHAVLLSLEHDIDTLLNFMQSIKFDYLQYYGEIDGSVIDKFKDNGIKLLYPLLVNETLDLEAVCSSSKEILDFAELVIVDYKSTALGGTGKQLELELLARVMDSFSDYKNNIVIAGGINAENVASIISCTGAQFIDLASGVESGQAGIKDLAKIKQLIANCP